MKISTPNPSRNSLKWIAALAAGILLGAVLWKWPSPPIEEAKSEPQIGDVIDRLNGVVVYYNGDVGRSAERHLAPDGYNLGIKYQCVEFVKRYYYQHLGHRMPDSYGHAKDFFNPALEDGGFNAQRNLVQYANGGRSKPQAEDLLVFNSSTFNPYGHVAIVSRVTDDGLEIVQQNAGPYGSSRAMLDLAENGGSWKISDNRVLGWLRKRLGGGPPTALENLGSPVQTMRDQAAAELRLTFQGSPRSEWEPALEKIKKGQSKKEVVELLKPYKVIEKSGEGSGQSHSQVYRFDDQWALFCTFENTSGLLLDFKLASSLKHVWVAPPQTYTGKWVVYFINGRKSHEIDYKEGLYSGEFILYNADGSKAVVQHYVSGTAEGPDTGYYPSGNVSYRGQYQAGKRVGTWTWYDEQGGVGSTQDLNGKGF